MRVTGARRGVALRSATAVVIVAFGIPFVALLTGSLRPAGIPPGPVPALVPEDATLENYVTVTTSGPFLRQARNSALVAAIAVPLGLLVASWAGFAIARLPPRTAIVLVIMVVAAASIPSSAVFVGRLVVFRWLHVTDTPVPLIAPALVGVSPLLVLLFAWSYATLPRSLYDVARESGLGPLRTWWRVALPLRSPVMIVAAAIAFVVTWGDYMDPLIYVYDPRWYTLPLGLASLASSPPTDQPVMLAAVVLTLIPVVVAVAVAGRALAAGSAP